MPPKLLTSEKLERSPFLQNAPKGQTKLGAYLAALAIFLTCFADVYALTAVFGTPENPKFIILFVAVSWSIIPPIWFWAEYRLIFGKYGSDFEVFRHQQQIAAAVWAGILAGHGFILTALPA